jgi:PAS domain S-box-containing protein
MNNPPNTSLVAEKKPNWLSRLLRAICPAARQLECENQQLRAQIAALPTADEMRLYRPLFELTQDAVFIFGLDLKYIAVNPQVADMLGYTIDELLTLTMLDVIQPGEKADANAKFQAALRGAKLPPHQRRGRRKDGSELILEIVLALVTDDDGQPLHFQGIARDVTERKQTQAALEDERNLLRALLDAMPVQVYVKDRDTHLMKSNRAHWEAVGAASEAEVVGKTAFDFFDPQFAHKLAEVDQRVMQSGTQILNHDEHSIKPDGTERWLSTSKVPLRDADGQVIGLIGVTRDITALKQTQTALEDERNRLRTLLDTIPDSIFVKDLEGRFTVINERAWKVDAQLSSEAEMLGKTDFDFQPPEYARQFAEIDQRVIQTGQPDLRREEPISSMDGQIRWLETSKAPLRDADGEIVGLVGVAHDITALKQTQTTLETERNLLRTLIDTIPQAIVVKDRAGRFTMINRHGYETERGLSSEDDLLGKTDYDFHPEDSSEDFESVDEQVMSSGEPDLLREETIIMGDGSARQVLTSKAPVRDSNGEVVGLILITNDVTDLKKAQQATEETRRRLSLLVEQMPLALIERDLDERIMTWNPAAERLLGYAAEEVMTLHNLAFLVPDYDLNEVGQVLIDTTRQDRPMINVNDNVTKDGRIITCEWYNVPLINERGALVSTVSMALDITERKQAQADLTEERDFKAAILNTTNALIVVLDKDHRCVSFNRAAEELSGYTEDEVRGQHPWNLFVLPDDRDRVKTLIEEVGDTAEINTTDHYWQARDGSLHLIRWTNTALIDPQGNRRYTISTGIDLTAQHELEQDKFALQLEGERARVMRDLVRDISHDLRTPLATLGTSLYLLRRYDDPAKVEQRLNEMEGEITHMGQMLDQLSSMSTLERVHQLPLTAMDINQVITDLRPSMEKMAREKTLDLTFDLATEPASVQIHSLQFTLALTNVVKNAIQHTPADGAVTIRSRLGEDELVIEVQDTGQGIAPDDLPHIFQRFFRADRARSSQQGSTGLGLAISRKIIELHNGTISADSTLGEGTIFTITMPLSAGQSQTAERLFSD